MFRLLDRGLADEMVSLALKIARNKGISSRNEALLKQAAKTESLVVRNKRIYPSNEILESCMLHIQNNMVPEGNGIVRNHGWQDMLINNRGDSEVIIKLTDLPYQFCDHQQQEIVPLSRSHVIEGTKLLHVLSWQKGIRGNSCGVPQDTHAYLKSIEQYLIGYRYNQNGGGTIQSIPRQVESDYSLIRSIVEDWENPNARDLMLFSPSPMVLDSDDLYLCFQNGIKLNSFMVGSMPMMGMSGPIDPIGVYVLGIAEVLAAATVLHAIFPDAKVYVYPHPQAMSLHTGQMAFGTVEHARLEMMKKEIMDVLRLPYYNLKDIMTSAQMPGPMAQGDKALGFFSGIMAGYRAFNLMPLSTDQVWSPEQALLDIENLQNAWKVLEPVIPQEESDHYGHICSVIDANMLFSESDHTLLHMYDHYDLDTCQKRHFASETWKTSGKPGELRAIEEKKEELISAWDYRPPQDKLEQAIEIYNGLCKQLNTEPLNLD